MKRPVKPIILLAILLSLCVISVTSIFFNSKLNEKLPDISNQKEQIQTLLNDRASVIISDNNLKPRINNTTNQLIEKENHTRTLIKEYREKLKKMNETYCKARTQIEIQETKLQEDGKLSIKVKETTYMTIDRNGIETGYTAEHEFIFDKNEADIWILIENFQLEPTGLLPLQQAQKSGIYEIHQSI